MMNPCHGGINQLLTTNKTLRYCTFIPPLFLLLMTQAAESFAIALTLTLRGGYENAIAPKTLCASYLMCQWFAMEIFLKQGTDQGENLTGTISLQNDDSPVH